MGVSKIMPIGGRSGKFCQTFWRHRKVAQNIYIYICRTGFPGCPKKAPYREGFRITGASGVSTLDPANLHAGEASPLTYSVGGGIKKPRTRLHVLGSTMADREGYRITNARGVSWRGVTRRPPDLANLHTGEVSPFNLHRRRRQVSSSNY